MADESKEQSAPTLSYATPPKRTGAERLALAAYVCGFVPFVLVAAALALASGHALGGVVWTVFLAMIIGAPFVAIGLGVAVRHRVPNPTEAVRHRSRSAMTMAVIQLCMIGLIALILPTLGRAREPAHRIKCAANLSSLYKASYLYATAHGGLFPPHLATLADDQGFNAELFECPSAIADRAPGATTRSAGQALRATSDYCSYVYCAAGLNEAGVSAAHVFAYELASNHPKGGGNVTYGDGRVEFLPRADLAYVIAEVTAGHNPPRARAASTEK